MLWKPVRPDNLTICSCDKLWGSKVLLVHAWRTCSGTWNSARIANPQVPLHTRNQEFWEWTQEIIIELNSHQFHHFKVNTSVALAVFSLNTHHLYLVSEHWMKPHTQAVTLVLPFSRLQLVGFLTPWICLFQTFFESRIIQCVVFCVRFLSLSLMLNRFIVCVTQINASLLFKAKWYSTVRLCNTSSIAWYAGELLGGFNLCLSCVLLLCSAVCRCLSEHLFPVFLWTWSLHFCEFCIHGCN